MMSKANKSELQEEANTIQRRQYWIQVFVLVCIFVQSCFSVQQINVLKRQVESEYAPRLYIDVIPDAFSVVEKDGSENIHLGGKLIYKNVGKVPARNIKTEIHLYDNIDKNDGFARWKDEHIKKWGSVPEPNLIFPSQEGIELPVTPDCSDSASRFMFTIRVSYTGEDPTKLYWYKTDSSYELLKDSVFRGHFAIVIAKVESDYDRNDKKKMPPPVKYPF